VVAIAAAAVVGVLLGLGLHALTDRTDGTAGASAWPAAEVRGQAVWPVGLRRAPEFSLVDSDSKRFTFGSVRGESAVITFMDSRCHQECPLVGRALAAGLYQVPRAERPLVIAISVDPWEDTPGSARRAMKRFGLAGFRWRWLLGTKAQLAPVWRKFHIQVRRTPGDIEHTDALYLVDARGFERAGMVYPFLPTWVATDLKTLASESG
jgi:cytochrome oxidase Cu insertion factor (SCO1/SenC/PrrC family)